MMLTKLIFLFAPAAMATLTPTLPRGEQIIQHDKGEICVIPSKLQGGEYSSKDKKNEQSLCSLSITGANTNTAACGKIVSTNPAIEFYSVPSNMSTSTMESLDCKLNPKQDLNDEAKKLAKYKLSTSCSYTPSILAYYHISRFLGDVNQVPVAVLRSVDVNRHLEIGRKTVSKVKEGSLISQTWGSLLSFIKPGSTHAKRANLMTDDGQQTFGALQKNPRNEQKYSELFNGGADQAARAVNFKANPVYKLLQSSRPLTSLVSNSFSKENVQTVLQMKNVSDMIILDTMLNQGDRFGNIHYSDEYFFIENGNVKSDGDLSLEEAKAKGAVLAKEMMMKDNDCGINRPNHLKDAGLLSGLSHVNPETYHKLISLSEQVSNDSLKSFFKKETMMSEADYTILKTNLASQVALLKKACREGRLQLDLDLDSHFAGAAVNTSCE